MITIKNISFFGTKTEDTIIYLATLLKGMDTNVCIVDFTGNIKYYFENGEDEIFTVNGVDIYNQAMPDELSAYEVVLLNFGYDEDFRSNLFESQLSIISTGLEKKEIQNLREMLLKQDNLKDYIKIFRDVVDTKLTKEYLDDILGSTHNTEEEYVLYLDEVEVKNRIKMQYFSEVTFKQLSREFKNMLYDIVHKVYEGEEIKVLIKKLKKVQKGRGI